MCIIRDKKLGEMPRIVISVHNSLVSRQKLILHSKLLQHELKVKSTFAKFCCLDPGKQLLLVISVQAGDYLEIWDKVSNNSRVHLL